MNRLKELRKEKKLTQEDLAGKIGVSKITILRWENGERQIKPEKAQQLADYFGVSIEYLLGYNERGIMDIDSLFRLGHQRQKECFWRTIEGEWQYYYCEERVYVFNKKASSILHIVEGYNPKDAFRRLMKEVLR